MTRGLEQLDVLLGEWVVASKKYSEGRGLTSVTRIDDGKFLRWESSEENDLFPRSTLMIGSDDARDESTVLYFDARGVHRVYHMSVVGDEFLVRTFEFFLEALYKKPLRDRPCGRSSVAAGDL